MRPAPFLQPGCPWYALHRLMPPNVKWCEAPRCAAIVEPANAWSNLAYVAVGLLLLRRPQDRRFGLAALAVGAGSFVYHASDAFVTQVLDFAGMYCFFLLPLCANLVRLGLLPQRHELRAYAGGVLALTALTPAWALAGLPVQAIIGGLLAGILITEARAPRPRHGRGSFFLSLALLFLAGACSLLDVTRTFCQPHSLLQGHALWHVLSALSLWAAARHYHPLSDERK